MLKYIHIWYILFKHMHKYTHTHTYIYIYSTHVHTHIIELYFLLLSYIFNSLFIKIFTSQQHIIHIHKPV